MPIDLRPLSNFPPQAGERANVKGAGLHAAIRKALAGSSSQQPVDVSRLYKLGDKASVQDVLLEMYHAREVSCCLNIKRGKETSVWWLVGGVSASHSYRTKKKAAS